MASVTCFGISPFLGLSSLKRPRSRLRAHSLGGGKDSVVLSSDSEVVNGVSVAEKREELTDGDGNGRSKPRVEEKKVGSVVDNHDDGKEKLEPFWDDGYGSETVKDYFDAVSEMVKPNLVWLSFEGFSDSSVFAWNGWYWDGSYCAPQSSWEVFLKSGAWIFLLLIEPHLKGW